MSLRISLNQPKVNKEREPRRTPFNFTITKVTRRLPIKVGSERQLECSSFPHQRCVGESHNDSSNQLLD